MNEEIKEQLKRSWDLTFIIVSSLLLALFIYLVPDDPVRIIIGIPFILFFPGYALIATLFPENRSLSVIERIALSMGLSIALVSLIGFGLNYTPLGIRLDPVLWVLILFIAVFSFFGFRRRSVSAEPFLPFSPGAMFKASKQWFHNGVKNDRTLTVIVVLSVLSSLIAIAYVVAVPKDVERFTEFYILGPGGKATDYPRNLTVNQSALVYLGIANHEHRTVNYTVEVWLANETFANNVTTVHQLMYVDQFSVTLGHVPVRTEVNWTADWQQPYNISSTVQGAYKIWFVLQLDGTPFQGVKYQDYANTPVQDRFLDMVSSNGNYCLNLNVEIKA